MDIRHLRYFIALAEELHFGRAAQRLSITQPPLSIAIKQLEEDVGVPLFLRSSKAVALTSAGTALYGQATKLLAQLEAARTMTREVGLGGRGRLAIGFVGGMLLRGVPELVAEYDRLQTGVAIHLREMSSADQINAIGRGQLGAGFLHATTIPAELDAVVLQSEPFVACLPEGHALARRQMLDVAELASENLVLFPREVSPGYYDSVIALCMASGFSPTIRHEVTHWLTAILLISRGGGVALVPAALATTGLAGVRCIAIRQSASRSLAHFVWKRGAADETQRAFVDFVVRHIARLPAR